jgi:hypothetical protein
MPEPVWTWMICGASLFVVGFLLGWTNRGLDYWERRLENLRAKWEQEDALEYTYDLPQESGWYWWKPDGDDYLPSCVEVVGAPNELFVRFGDEEVKLEGKPLDGKWWPERIEDPGE